jgi:hypothetical protein
LLISENADGTQPPEFINFPKSEVLGGFEYCDLSKKYNVALSDNGFDDAFFDTFNAETPIYNRDNTEIIGYKKVSTRAQSHDLDALVYADAAKEIYVSEVLTAIGEKTFNLDKVLKFCSDYIDENGVVFLG